MSFARCMCLEVYKMETKHIINLIEERKDELFELLSSLVKIPSEGTPSWGNEEQLARHIHSLCQELGLESELYSPLEIEGFEEHPDYLPGRGLENRYNVSAVWKGAEDVNELMLMGHSDTVQTGDPANWDLDPFSGLIKDGKIFGRGSVDDKYALATCLFIIKLLKEEGFEPKRNLVFSAYSDEEYGGSHGAMAASMKYPCNRIVNMDGRENQIWHCGSGGGEFKYTYHTADPADSAKTAALAIPVVLEAIDEFAKKRSEELEANRFYKGTIIPKTSLRYIPNFVLATIALIAGKAKDGAKDHSKLANLAALGLGIIEAIDFVVNGLGVNQRDDYLK